jgi:flagellar basal-body rod modification protein FlgD
MTTVAGVTATGLYTSSTATTAPKQQLDGEVFLQLLVTQLRSQDPSSPMDTNEMMGQMTQLASMEQLTAQSKTAQENFALQMRIAAAALVGKEVDYVDATGAARSGVVTRVSYAAGVPTVTIGDTTVSLDAVGGVKNAPAA